MWRLVIQRGGGYDADEENEAEGGVGGDERHAVVRGEDMEGEMELDGESDVEGNGGSGEDSDTNVAVHARRMRCAIESKDQTETNADTIFGEDDEAPLDDENMCKFYTFLFFSRRSQIV